MTELLFTCYLPIFFQKRKCNDWNIESSTIKKLNKYGIQ